MANADRAPCMMYTPAGPQQPVPNLYYDDLQSAAGSTRYWLCRMMHAQGWRVGAAVACARPSTALASSALICKALLAPNTPGALLCCMLLATSPAALSACPT